MRSIKWVTIGFSAFCVISVAELLNADRLYYMAAILLSLPLVSYAIGWFALRGVNATRETPAPGREGGDGELHYRVENRSRVPRFFLNVGDALPEWIEPLAERPLFNVAGEATVRIVQPVRFHKRGVYPMPELDLCAIDPLGVAAFVRHVGARDEIVVYPSPREVHTIPVAGSERFGTDAFQTPLLKGTSVDPDGVRPYVAGDPLRHIHWRQTARNGRLNVIEFEPMQSPNVVIALDLERGTEVGDGKETTLECAVRAAAAIATTAVEMGAGVSLIVPQEADAGTAEVPSVIASATLRTGRDQLTRILDALAHVQCGARQTLADLIRTRRGDLPRGVTLVALTARADPDLAPILRMHADTGARAMVLFADPALGEFTLDFGADKSDRFLASLAAAGCATYLIRNGAVTAQLTEAVVRDRPAEPNWIERTYRRVGERLWGEGSLSSNG